MANEPKPVSAASVQAQANIGTAGCEAMKRIKAFIAFMARILHFQGFIVKPPEGNDEYTMMGQVIRKTGKVTLNAMNIGTMLSDKCGILSLIKKLIWRTASPHGPATDKTIP